MKFVIIFAIILMIQISNQFRVDLNQIFSKVNRLKDVPSQKCQDAMNKRQVQLNSCCAGTVENSNPTIFNLTKILDEEEEPDKIVKERTFLFKTMCCVIDNAMDCADIIKEYCTSDDMDIVYGNVEELLSYNFTKYAHNLIELNCTKIMNNSSDDCPDYYIDNL